jgi:hypothetical protein
VATTATVAARPLTLKRKLNVVELGKMDAGFSSALQSRGDIQNQTTRQGHPTLDIEKQSFISAAN